MQKYKWHKFSDEFFKKMEKYKPNLRKFFAIRSKEK